MEEKKKDELIKSVDEKKEMSWDEQRRYNKMQDRKRGVYGSW